MNKLTLEEKRSRIIKFCKWEDISDSCYLRRTTYQCVVEGGLITVGDPFEDLNAMHEAEKLFIDSDTSQLWSAYMIELNKLTFSPTHATASQRAKAFGLTFNLWEQGQ